MYIIINIVDALLYLIEFWTYRVIYKMSCMCTRVHFNFKFQILLQYIHNSFVHRCTNSFSKFLSQFNSLFQRRQGGYNC
jgi:hypothetical protein